MKVINLKKYTTQGSSTLHREVSAFANLPDNQIWNQFRQGDDSAFAHIYNEYAPALFNFGCQLFMDRELIKDCIQDLFVDLKIKRKKLTEVRSIKAYLYKSLHNLVRKRLKKKGKSLETESGQQDFIIDLSIDARIIDSETATARLKWLQESLNKLNKRQRQAILLYYYEGMNYDQVREIMEMKSVDGVRMLIKRGLEKLKDHANGDDLLFTSGIVLLQLLGTL